MLREKFLRLDLRKQTFQTIESIAARTEIQENTSMLCWRDFGMGGQLYLSP